MEQFRAFLEKLKKYHFWVLCGLIVLLSFATCFLANSAKDQGFLTRKRQIETQRGLVNKIKNYQEQPSTSYIQKIRDIESGPLTTQVATASERLYREMRESNPLPILFSDEENQKGFEKAFNDVWRPMEDIEKLPADQLNDFYRNRYRNHIAGHFPELFKLIERRGVDDADDPLHGPHGQPQTFGGMGAGALAKSTTGIVDWDNAKEKIKTFEDRFSGAVPTTLDIMMAQEELWVYETLLKVVRNTNNFGDKDHYLPPTNHKTARIKQILAMDIGRDAVQSWTSCERSLFNSLGEAGGGKEPDTHGTARSGSVQASAGQVQRAGPGNTPASGSSSLAGRYVNDKGKPLTDPSQQPYGEFRMMPIDLKVVIEQKDIPRLLAECANSAMRIDVRAVRILVQQPGTVDLTAREAPAGHATGTAGVNTGQAVPSSREGAMARFGGSGGGPVGRDFGSGTEEFVYNEESSDAVYQPVPVEVQGIIYIYNPPKVQNSGQTAGAGSSQALPAAAGPVATPPAAPGGPVPAAPRGPGPVAAPAAPAAGKAPATPLPATPHPGGGP